MQKGLYLSLLVLLLAGVVPVAAQKPVFNHAALHVTNLQESVAFYKDLVGLDTIPEPFRDGKHAWLAIGTGIELHLVAGAARAKSHHPMNNHLCLSIPSLAPFIARLEQAGVPYVNARGQKNTVTQRPDGVKQIYLQDPDGYWVEINDARK
jgi:lactoylglutathione lyase